MGSEVEVITITALRLAWVNIWRKSEKIHRLTSQNLNLLSPVRYLFCLSENTFISLLAISRKNDQVHVLFKFFYAKYLVQHTR